MIRANHTLLPEYNSRPTLGKYYRTTSIQTVMEAVLGEVFVTINGLKVAECIGVAAKVVWELVSPTMKRAEDRALGTIFGAGGIRFL